MSRRSASHLGAHGPAVLDRQARGRQGLGRPAAQGRRHQAPGLVAQRPLLLHLALALLAQELQQRVALHLLGHQRGCGPGAVLLGVVLQLSGLQLLRNESRWLIKNK